MREHILDIRKRIIAIILMAVLILMQSFFLLSIGSEGKSYAGDGSLEVRIQYEGWRGDKIPVKAKFSRSELESIGNSVHKYTNVTDVATILRIVGKGPKLTDVLDAAGIDRSSIKYVVFRTTDGSGKHSRYSMQLEPWEYESNRLYYPNLANNYERDSEEGIIKPNEGSLSGAERVPVILATSYYCTKNDNDSISNDRMKSHDLLRLCIGQTEIKEGQWTEYGYSGDVTSHQSVQLIFGVDVILKGSPDDDAELGIDDDNGSGAKTGSEDNIAGGGDNTANKGKATANKAKVVKKSSGVTVKEVLLGDKIEAETEEESVIQEVKALGEAENYSKGALAGTIGGAIAACTAGFVLRIRKYRIDK